MNRDLIFEKLERLIRSYGPNRLSRDSGISRQGIYRLISERNPRYETLDKIAMALQIDLDITKALPTTDDIYSSLKFHGAPLRARETKKPLSLEETIARGISISRTDGLIISIVPFLLFKKADKVNIPSLIALCDGLGEVQALGYYADIANTFRPNKKLAKLVDVLDDLPFKQELLSKNTRMTESLKKLIKIIENPIAKKWKFITIDSLAHHFERYDKWLMQE
jgi:transcriptional regulator with XRE-family HTH domain